MPLSRAQKLEQNERRLAEITQELGQLVEAQASSIDADEQKALLSKGVDLQAERQALENACTALREELAQAEIENAERSVRIWTEKERPHAEKEIDAAVDVCFRRLKSFAQSYEALRDVEERHKQVWISRGRPGKLAFRSRAMADVYHFLSVESLRTRGARPTQQKAMKILGPTRRMRILSRISVADLPSGISPKEREEASDES